MNIMIVLGSVIGILLIAFATLIARLLYERGKMTPLETREVVEGVFAIKDQFVNLYLIRGRDGYVAIDAGMTVENVRLELENLHIEPEKVIAVLLTHTDRDHVGALGLFKNARVYLAREEEQMINGKTPRFLILKNSLHAPYTLMEDGHSTDLLGLKMKAILTPGHTPGSMCYLIDDRYLFTGDTISLKAGKADLFNNLFNMNSNRQHHSLNRLKGIPDVKYIFSSHHGVADNYEKALEDW
jgi:glyoxylase-like metal-dependent hydrolase (beta-lactamase superfamily II)